MGRVLLCATTLAFAGLSSAVAQAGAPRFTSAGTITQLNARETSVEVVVPSAAGSPMSFTGYTAGVYRISSSASNYAVIVSALIAAYSSGKAVELWNSGCDTDGAPLISAAFII
jgi:hypothetical protein